MERHKIINHMEREKEPSAVFKGGIFALIALLISYLGFSIPTFVESLKQDIQWRASALQLSLEPILFGGVVFMPIVCAWASYVPYHKVGTYDMGVGSTRMLVGYTYYAKARGNTDNAGAVEITGKLDADGGRPISGRSI